MLALLRKYYLPDHAKSQTKSNQLKKFSPHGNPHALTNTILNIFRPEVSTAEKSEEKCWELVSVSRLISSKPSLIYCMLWPVN